MHILITNYLLDHPGGTETYVRELALGLLKRGHTPIVYSTILGPVAEDLRQASIPVVDNLNNVKVTPDIIHGHHHINTMTALLHFPDVPAIYYCHSWLNWEETPLKFPRIFRYLAVDNICLDRLILEHGIPKEKASVLLNFVDLERFKQRKKPLPDHPRRALIFSNYANESNYIQPIREACTRMGIALDIVGRGVGNGVSNPEHILENYDIVFAKAKAAMEAMAVGCPVILCDSAGAGLLVTTTNFDQLRKLNFGKRALEHAPEVDFLEQQIRLYDRIEAQNVSTLIRNSADHNKVIDTLVGLYTEVISESKSNGNGVKQEENKATADYLCWLTSRFHEYYRMAEECDRLLLRINGYKHDVRRLTEERNILQKSNDSFRIELERASWRNPSNYVRRINRLFKAVIARIPFLC